MFSSLSSLSCFLLLLLSPPLSLSDYSVVLSKSNYMCLITSRAIKPLVRGARRSSLMMTIKRERARDRDREKKREGRREGRQGYRWEMKEAFRCPFYYLLSVAPVVKNPSGELVVAVLSQIYGSEGKKGERVKRMRVEVSHSSPCNCCLHLGGYEIRHGPPLKHPIQLLLALLSQRAFEKKPSLGLLLLIL